MTSQLRHRNKTHSCYSELNYIQDLYFGFFIFRKLTELCRFVINLFIGRPLFANFLMRKMSHTCTYCSATCPLLAVTSYTSFVGGWCAMWCIWKVQKTKQQMPVHVDRIRSKKCSQTEPKRCCSGHVLSLITSVGVLPRAGPESGGIGPICFLMSRMQSVQYFSHSWMM